MESFIYQLLKLCAFSTAERIVNRWLQEHNFYETCPRCLGKYYRGAN